MFRFNVSCSRWCLPVLLVVGGCGGSDNPMTVRVTGTVKLDGAPLPGASVSFSPISKEGRAAGAMTDMQGNYSLTSFVSGDGAMPGSYVVGISKSEGGPTDPDIRGDDEDAFYKAMEEQNPKVTSGGGNAQRFKSLVPQKYVNPGTSGLKAEVSADRKNAFDFDLPVK